MAKATDTPRPDPNERVGATRARQGAWGRHVLWVLLISITLAAIALFASLAFHADDMDGQGGMTRQEEAVAPMLEGDPPAPRQQPPAN